MQMTTAIRLGKTFLAFPDGCCLLNRGHLEAKKSHVYAALQVHSREGLYNFPPTSQTGL